MSRQISEMMIAAAVGPIPGISSSRAAASAKGPGVARSGCRRRRCRGRRRRRGPASGPAGTGDGHRRCLAEARRTLPPAAESCAAWRFGQARPGSWGRVPRRSRLPSSSARRRRRCRRPRPTASDRRLTAACRPGSSPRCGPQPDRCGSGSGPVTGGCRRGGRSWAAASAARRPCTTTPHPAGRSWAGRGDA
jgi:hypothetical protein